MLSDRDVTHPGVLLGALSLGRLASRGRISVLLTLSLYGSMIGGASACSSDSTGPNRPIPTSAQAFWTLQLNQHAVMLALTAPVNTIQLTATPLNADGAPLSGLGPVHYKASDTTIQVDSTGLVTAQFTTQVGATSFVAASLTDPEQNVTLVDTCYIRVTATAPASPLANISIQPTNGDSARRALNNGEYTVQATATDVSNAAYTDFFAYFYTIKDGIGTINKLGRAAGKGVGQVTYYAQTWSYGVAAQDSLMFEWTYPLAFTFISAIPITPTGQLTPVLTFWPQSVTVGVGAWVEWYTESYTDSIDVVFDDPTNVDSMPFLGLVPGVDFPDVPSTGRGNISPWLDDTTLVEGDTSIANRLLAWTRVNFDVCHEGDHRCGFRERRFPVAGVYHYHSRIQHSTGTIYVQ